MNARAGTSTRARAGAPVGVPAAVAASVLMMFSGCVTETVPRSPRGLPAQRVTGGKSLKPAPGEPASLPTGPVVRPVTGDHVVGSHVVVAVRPMGTVPFDGLTLPMISPDGRFAAVQLGEAPSWATVLAVPGASVSRTSVRVFDLSVSPPRAVEFGPGAGGAEVGLMLGRDADDRGVLVESHRADGSRWIGKLAWRTGEVEWLARDGRVSAHGVLGPAGELVFTRREVDGEGADLVVSAAGGGGEHETVLNAPDAASSFEFPCVSGSGRTVLVFVVSPKGLEARAYPLGGGETGGAGTVPVTARRVLSSSGDPMQAYQAVAAVQPQRADAPSDDVFRFHHPTMGRMVLFDAASGQMTTLAERSIAGVRDPGTGGVFLTTPRGLVHQGLATGDAGVTAVPEARVLGDSWVARRTTSVASPYVLIGPGPKGQPGTLQLTAMEIVR